MQRPQSCCDFCGGTQGLQEYPTDPIVRWYACAECASIIEAEAWEHLVQRSLAAYAHIRLTPDPDEPVLGQQVEHLVQAFRACQLAALLTRQI